VKTRGRADVDPGTRVKFAAHPAYPGGGAQQGREPGGVADALAVGQVGDDPGVPAGARREVDRVGDLQLDVVGQAGGFAELPSAAKSLGP